MITPDTIQLMRELARHLMALLLVSGFIGICFLAVLGYVDVSNPTVAGFLGTVIGATASQLDRPLAAYFGRLEPARVETGRKSDIVPTPPAAKE